MFTSMPSSDRLDGLRFVRANRCVSPELRVEDGPTRSPRERPTPARGSARFGVARRQKELAGLHYFSEQSCTMSW
jgi:hypothetical protein